jgi:hypothetical protein
LTGLEPDVVGVDPVDAMLDAVTERYEAEGLRETVPATTPAAAAGQAGEVGAGGAGLPAPPPGDGSARTVRSSWLLDDGPVQPESLARCGGLPPLVFSNSHGSLPVLGQRFLAAGASTFVGPLVALYSRPARRFAAHFYGFLSEGRCAGAALHAAALALRSDLGAEHPAWLSYGLTGYPALALQYL